MSHRACQAPDCGKAVFSRGFCPEHHATHCVSGIQTAADRRRDGHEDMVLLETLSNDAIVDNLRRRHKADLIYTYIGDVLVSVNPFKRVPVYGDDHVRQYSGRHRTELPPHIFATAEAAFRNMLAEEEPQTVVISGESGAGKTEAARQVLAYVAAISGGGEGGAARERVTRTKDVILRSNPLLEAFGNAKTLRNDNSSRFGKLFEVFFDAVGAPRGGSISNYLLEKSRVCKQQRGERNFHIFYQLLAGAPRQARKALGLDRAPDSYAYLASGCAAVDGIDDRADFAEVRAALKSVGVRGREQEAIFTVVAGVLHLGGVSFAERPGASAAPRVDGAATAARLLGLGDGAALARALTHRRIRTGGGREEVDAVNNAEQAANTRDAVAKDVYDRLFSWIVRRVNSALVTDDAKQQQQQLLSLSVLDIFGFEIFERNSFEQFCINFINERLQQYFVAHTLRAEQEEYAAEGISWKPISYFDNRVVVDLLEGARPPGVFLVLDDVCATMHADSSGTGAALVGKLAAAHSSNRHFRTHGGGFAVRHFAGEVEYDASDFGEKNADTLSADVLAVLRASDSRLLRVLYPPADAEAEPEDGGRRSRRRRPTTVGSKVRKNTAGLMRKLTASTPLYVRCVKSNDRKRGDTFDARRVLHQVKYLGLLENVRVRRAGFSFRAYFDAFARRFRLLSPRTWPGTFSGPDRSAVKAILKSVTASGELRLGREEVQLGSSKVFIRSPETLFRLEDLKERRVGELVSRIQRAWRRWRDGKEFVRLRRRAAALLAPHKERRRESFYRPFHGVYVEVDAPLRDVVASFGPPAERVVFADEALKLVHPYPFNHGVTLPAVSSAAGDFCAHTVLLTGRALYFTVRQEGRVLLTRRVPLDAVAHVSLSCLADNYLFVHASPEAGGGGPAAVEWMRDGAAKACLVCAAPFSLFRRRHHCRLCGRLFCHACSSRTQALPDYRLVDPVRVCDECYGQESCEFLMDVILVTPKKTELLVLLQAQYRGATGRDLDVRFTDSITYTVKQSMVSSFATEVRFRREKKRAAPPSPDADGQLAPPRAVGDRRLEVRVPGGLPPEFVEGRRRAAERRRKEAAARDAADAEARRRREAEREAEREAARRERLERRKREKREQAAREQEQQQQQQEKGRGARPARAAKAAPAAASGPAVECCSDFMAHPFKAKTCANCFRRHA